MIIIKHREMLFNNKEQYLGTPTDTNSETRTFRIDRIRSGPDIADLTFKFDLLYEDGTLDTTDLEKTIDDDYIYLTLNILNSMLQQPGVIFVAIRAYDSTGSVRYSTYKAAMYCGDTVDAPSGTSGQLTQLEALERRIDVKFGNLETWQDEVEATIDTKFDELDELEETRDTAEGLRENAEAQRQANEAARVAAEAGRAADMQLFNTNALRALTNANTAVTNAETSVANLVASINQRAASGEWKGDKGDKGEKGDPGESGVTVFSMGIFTMWVDSAGDLYVDYPDTMPAPVFEYDPITGDLYYITEDE